MWNFFGKYVAPNTVMQNSDGSITLLGGGESNGQIASAEVAPEGSFHGIAFGGGAYFEAVFKFDGWQNSSENPNQLSNGFPAFWTMSFEHLANQSADQWPGQKNGYKHFAEFDVFEYDAAYTQRSDDIYAGSVHDWYGVFDVTCPNPAGRFCNVQSSTQGRLRNVPAGTDFSAYHTYGALWVPATDTVDGYLQWYFDGVQIGDAVSWRKLSNPSGISTPGSFASSVADLQHMVLLLGTGTPYPMTVSEISVWQASTNNNLQGE